MKARNFLAHLTAAVSRGDTAAVEALTAGVDPATMDHLGDVVAHTLTGGRPASPGDVAPEVLRRDPRGSVTLRAAGTGRDPSATVGVRAVAPLAPQSAPRLTREATPGRRGDGEGRTVQRVTLRAAADRGEALQAPPPGEGSRVRVRAAADAPPQGWADVVVPTEVRIRPAGEQLAGAPDAVRREVTIRPGRGAVVEQLAHEQLAHEQLAHEQLAHEQLAHEQLTHEQLAWEPGT